jgi:VanZ family protein
LSTLQKPPYTGAFRVVFIVTVVLISYLAFGHVEETPIADINDKLEHAAAFLTLAFLLDFSWPDRAWGSDKLLPLLAYGLFIEVVQYFLPYREFSLWDLAADCLGLIAYPLTIPLLKRVPGLAHRWNSVTN